MSGRIRRKSGRSSKIRFFENLGEWGHVLPSADIERDVAWYEQYTGFSCARHDGIYALLQRENLKIHLQWHANTEHDPLLGGSVIKLFVDDIQPMLDGFVARGTIPRDKLRMNNSCGTHEFGFYAPDNHEIFVGQDA